MAVRLTKKQKQAQNDFRIAETQWTRYRRARDGGHSEYLKTAKKCNDFYTGDQWDEKDKQKLDSQGRPYLTINMILATVNAVLGEQTSKRVEFKYKPSQGGEETTATVLTKITQAIKDANRYDYVESQVFQDGVIEDGRGFFDIRMNFDTNVRGDIKITRSDPRNTIIDPDAKEYDPATWTEVFETSWLTPDQVEETYGKKKAEQIETLAINNSRFESDSIEFEDDTYGDAREREGQIWVPNDHSEEKTIRRVRIVERQHAKFVPCWKFVDAETGDTKTVPPTWSEKKMRDFALNYNLFLTKGSERKVRWTTTCDKVVLHDDWSPYRTFTKIPYFCYFRPGKPFGLVTNLLSPQEQLNKLSSQELHIVNTTANSGWIFETGSLVGMSKDDLSGQGAESGLVIEAARGRKDSIEKIKPNQIPTGIERLSVKSAGSIKEISGVNEALLGQENPEVSGVALQENKYSGLTQLQVPFDNLDYTRHLVGEKILELIQQFFTEERVFKISTNGMNFEDPENEEIIINHQAGAGEVVNDVTMGKYSVNLAMFPARDSFNDSQFAEVLNLRNVGVAIPDDRVVEYSHLARKDQLADEIREMTGRGEITEEQAMMQQYAQQIQLRMMEAEASQAEAEVAKTEAEMAKLYAEASQKAGGIHSPEMQMRMNELQLKLTDLKTNAQLRRDLAQLSAQAQLDKIPATMYAKLATDTNAKREDRKTAVLTKPQPSLRQ